MIVATKRQRRFLQLIEPPCSLRDLVRITTIFASCRKKYASVQPEKKCNSLVRTKQLKSAVYSFSTNTGSANFRLL